MREVSLSVLCWNISEDIWSVGIKGTKIPGESVARGPKLLSMYTVEQRRFLVRKNWQTVDKKNQLDVTFVFFISLQPRVCT